jgi:hypothetical protein
MVSLIDRLLYNRGATPVAYKIGGCVGPTDEVKALQKRKIEHTGNQTAYYLFYNP